MLDLRDHLRIVDVPHPLAVLRCSPDLEVTNLSRVLEQLALRYRRFGAEYEFAPAEALADRAGGEAEGLPELYLLSLTWLNAQDEADSTAPD